VKKLFVAPARLVVSLLVLGVIAGALSARTVHTQGAPQTISAARRAGPPKGPIPRLPSGQPDLSDVAWLATGGNFREHDALLLPAAKAILDKRDVTQDPHNFCMPDIVPRTTPFPIRFFFNYTHKTPTHLVIVHEGNIHSFRQIFMDGRKHPAELDPTWFGHSIGWWEGDTLVIDTVGYNDKFWFDRRGHPHTEQLHTIERWTRLDLGRMENKVTIDDPGAYTKPFTLTFMATLSPPGDELLEYICQENNQYGVQTLPGFKGDLAPTR
jgi:hypothetical protein